MLSCDEPSGARSGLLMTHSKAYQISEAVPLRLQGHRLTMARVTWLTVALIAIAAIISAIPPYYDELRTVCGDLPNSHCDYWQLTPGNVRSLERLGLSIDDYAAFTLSGHLLSSLVFFAVGALIIWHKSDEWMGLFASALLIVIGSFGISDTMVSALVSEHPEWRWLTAPLGLAQWPALGVFLLSFPDGRFVPRWSRLMVLLWVAQVGFFVLPPPYNFDNWPPALAATELLLTYGGTLAVQAYRYRRLSDKVVRQQTKWLVFGVSAALLLVFAYNSLPSLIPALGMPDSPYQLAGASFTMLFFTSIPVSVGIAVLRYRLWDIDPIINRALVYGTLTAGVVSIYVLVVGYLGAVFPTGGNLAISLLATVIVAIIFDPLRERVQRGINRLMYGERDEPYAVLSRLGRRMEATLDPVEALPVLVETVAQALKLPYAAISLSQGGVLRLVAAHGVPAGDLLRLPLVYGGEIFGEMALAPRAPGEQFSIADRRLLEDLARQAAPAAHAALLTADLERSRMRAVTAREEAHSRLGSDLHDGLGHRLAGLLRKAETASNLVGSDPAASKIELESLVQQAQATVADVRSLAHALHPPELELLGLASALRERAQSACGEGGGPRIEVHAPESLPPLPAAVETAAYYIALEALTNVQRHSGARHCELHLRLVDDADAEQSTLIGTAVRALELEITDDGCGPMSRREGGETGLGIGSMRERALELGGACSVEPAVMGGTRVFARLPIVQ